ncbi:hypothetical protein DYQ86_23385 [Acidobacteria bacterium AB60]|nr:hypothetical protein DYQ86_23385 [Acidobacteria bacterium AB60]
MSSTLRVNPDRRSAWHRHQWILWVTGAAFVCIAVTAAIFTIAARRFEPYVRARIVDELAQHFHTRVELASFHVAVQHGQSGEWGLWAQGKGLRIWPPNLQGSDLPVETTPGSLPLIDLGDFSFHLPLRSEMMQHLRISEVRLKDLKIVVPPHSGRDPEAGIRATRSPQESPGTPASLANVTVERVVCEGGDILLQTDKPNRAPLEFPIAHLQLSHVAVGKPIAFQAELTNPRPQGVIHTAGDFGPWLVSDPGGSPVTGKYLFDHADLSTFNGIAGILSSSGTYEGTLRQITAEGDANVPDFRLTGFGNDLPLVAKFHARVDATDGDTWLEPVEATLGRSHFTTRGKVVRIIAASPAPVAAISESKLQKPSAGKAAETPAPAVPAAPMLPKNAPRSGHVIDLNVEVDRGHLEDFMRLVSHSANPLLVGPVAAHANLHIPPGPQPVHLRMKLDGSFKLQDALFTNERIQDRVEELSLRGQGRPDAMKNTDPNSIRSTMEGAFHVDRGIIGLPDLTYTVPGASVALNGSIAFSGHIKFEGAARMDATVSRIVGGWKGFLLKPVDRYFRRDGAGALIPIHIRGSRDAPEIGVDLGRLKQTSPERPGEKANTAAQKAH